MCSMKNFHAVGTPDLICFLKEISISNSLELEKNHLNITKTAQLSFVRLWDVHCQTLLYVCNIDVANDKNFLSESEWAKQCHSFSILQKTWGKTLTGYWLLRAWRNSPSLLFMYFSFKLSWTVFCWQMFAPHAQMLAVTPTDRRRERNF